MSEETSLFDEVLEHLERTGDIPWFEGQTEVRLSICLQRDGELHVAKIW